MLASMQPLPVNRSVNRWAIIWWKFVCVESQEKYCGLKSIK